MITFINIVGVVIILFGTIYIVDALLASNKMKKGHKKFESITVGNNIQFNNRWTISKTGYSFEAISPNPFILRTSNGLIDSVENSRPLGWNHKQAFMANGELPVGEFNKEKGYDISIRLIHPDDEELKVELTHHYRDRVENWPIGLLILTMGVIVFTLSSLIIAR